jgi:hypothetical protein
VWGGATQLPGNRQGDACCYDSLHLILPFLITLSLFTPSSRGIWCCFLAEPICVSY